MMRERVGHHYIHHPDVISGACRNSGIDHGSGEKASIRLTAPIAALTLPIPHCITAMSFAAYASAVESDSTTGFYSRIREKG